MKVLMIDNYDSFTYNLVQYLNDVLDTHVDVVRNDQFEMEAITHYDALVLSPGPGIPSEAGLLLEVIQRYATEKPILGVCLGHQAIGEVFGGTLRNIPKVYHGIATPIELLDKETPLFANCTLPLEVGRYHSWVVSKEGFPSCLEILAEDDEGEIMAMKHKEYPIYGVQFHPESVLTPSGKKMIENFVHIAQNQVTNSVALSKTVG